jgi:dihydroxyacetone kinase-like predicted kinase
VHVHVADPGAAIEAGIEAGRPRRIRVTALEEARPAGRYGRAVVAITAGEGLAALFREAGARAVPTRPGRRPDADDLLAEILGSRATEVVVLPNDRRCQAAAEAAAAAAEEQDVRVVVVPTSAQVQGLAALAVHDPYRWFEDDVVEMTAAARHARSGAVTVATRKAITTAGTCEPGDVLGVIEGDFAVIGDGVFGGAREVVVRLVGGGGELVTLVAGAGGAELADRCASYLSTEHPMVDVTVYEGGQERYPLLVGVE